jgi:hypothetical protein
VREQLVTSEEEAMSFYDNLDDRWAKRVVSEGKELKRYIDDDISWPSEWIFLGDDHPPHKADFFTSGENGGHRSSSGGGGGGGGSSSFGQCVPIRVSGGSRRRHKVSAKTRRSTAPDLPIIGEDEEVDPEADEQQERDALVGMWHALDGENWRRSGNWCSDKPLEEWEGVKIASKRVVELKLVNNMLRGPIPPSIAKLVMLKRLLLAENFIEGPLPDALSRCSNLEIITLNDNEIAGELNSSMAKLQQLQQLNLSENSITGRIPASWARLTSLERIVLWGNQLSGRLPWMTGDEAPMLRYLDLRNNNYEEGDKACIRATFGEQIPSHNLSL